MHCTKTMAACAKKTTRPHIFHEFRPHRASASPREGPILTSQTITACVYFWNLRLLSDRTKKVFWGMGVVFNVEMGKWGNMEVWKYAGGEMWKWGSGEVGKWGNMQVGKYGNGNGIRKWGNGEMIYGNGHWRAWFLRAVMMLAEKMRVKETASSMRAANLRFST